jgi:hypothetical protein
VTESVVGRADNLKRKRKLIVRDWFHYVLWSLRLKKILKGTYPHSVLEREIEMDPITYNNAPRKIQN